MSLIDISDIGYVIHVTCISDTSRQIELFTLDNGRVTAFYRIPKKGASCFSLELQCYNALSLSMKKNSMSHFAVIKDVSLAGEQCNLQLPKIFIASYCNELLYYLFFGRERNVELFGAYVSVLRSLEQGKEEIECLRMFQLALLNELGYSIRIDINDIELQRNLNYGYNLEKGFYRHDFIQRQLGFTGQELLNIKQGNLSSDKLKHLLSYIFTVLLKGRPLISRRLYKDYLQRTG